MEVLKASLAYRAIALLVTKLKEWYGFSALGAASLAMSKAYESSRTRRIWEGFCGRRDPAEFSVFNKILAGIERLLHTAGDWLENSLFLKLMLGIRKIYERIGKGGLVLGLVNKIPLRRWLLVVFAFYLPIEYLLRDKFKLDLLASVWEELLIIAAAALLLWRVCRRQSRTFTRTSALEVALLLYMAVLLLEMMLNRPFKEVAFAGYRAQCEYIVWFFLISRLCEDREDVKLLFGSFLGVVGLMAFHGIYQFIVAVPIPSSWITSTEMGVRTRVFSITGSPNIFGSILVMAAPSAAALMYYFKDTWKKLAALCLTGAMCLSILFTFSRGAWVGLIVAIVIFAMYMDRRLLGLMGAAMASVLVAVPSITARLTYLFTYDYKIASAIGGRALRWSVGWDLLHERSPWLGFGLGRFGGAVAMNNKLLDESDEFKYFYMDNYYLKTLVETGYIGLTFYLIALVAFVIMSLRAIYSCGGMSAPERSLDPLRRYEATDKPIAVGFFAGMSGVLAHCYFENIFEEPYMMAYFWGLAALLYCLGRLNSTEKEI